MKRVITLLSAIFIVLSATAQQADSIAGEYINRSEWFKLQEVYDKNSSKMSPFIRQFTKAMLDYSFNRTDDMRSSMNDLLMNQQGMLGFGNSCSIVQILAENYSSKGENAKASDIMEKFVKQISGSVKQQTLETFMILENRYKALAKYEINKIAVQNDAFTFNFKQEMKGDSIVTLINIGGKINGKKQNIIFDTGASKNVVTKEVAEKCRMRIIADSVMSFGTKALSGQLAIADSIVAGDLKIYNVPFYVLDINKGNERIKQHTDGIQAILGLPFMTLFEEICLDFGNNEITARKHATPKNAKSNMCINLGTTLCVNAFRNKESLIMNLDCGSDATIFSPKYYENHIAEVARYGKSHIGGMAGFGGIIYQTSFIMPDICLNIAEKPLCIKKAIVVMTTSTPTPLLNFDGTIGLDSFRKMGKIVIDFKNMVFAAQ